MREGIDIYIRNVGGGGGEGKRNEDEDSWKRCETIGKPA